MRSGLELSGGSLCSAVSGFCSFFLHLECSGSSTAAVENGNKNFERLFFQMLVSGLDTFLNWVGEQLCEYGSCFVFPVLSVDVQWIPFVTCHKSIIIVSNLLSNCAVKGTFVHLIAICLIVRPFEVNFEDCRIESSIMAI